MEAKLKNNVDFPRFRAERKINFYFFLWNFADTEKH